jgi:hypothetical protein
MIRTTFDRMASDPSPAGIEHQDIGLARISQELFGKATAELARIIRGKENPARALLKLKGGVSGPSSMNYN